MLNDIMVWEKVSMPDFLYSYGDCIYTRKDKEIISDTDCEGFVLGDYRRSWMENLFRRGVLDKIEVDGKIKYKVAHIASRLESFIVLEKSYWLSLSSETRDVFNSYIMNPDIWLPPRINQNKVFETILPFEESLKILEESDTEYYFLAECNCNNYIMGCEKDKHEICIHFPSRKPEPNSPDGRKLSKRVTRQEAIDALHYAKQMGLIHKLGPSGESFCNCCVDCCIHHHDAEKYQKILKGSFIRTPYEINVDEDKCVGCQVCLKRCQFEALQLSGKTIVVDKEKCWGCGNCRESCKMEALSIIKK